MVQEPDSRDIRTSPEDGYKAGTAATLGLFRGGVKLHFRHRYATSQLISSSSSRARLDGRGQRLDRGGLSYICRSIGKAAAITRFVVTPHVIRHTMNMVRRIRKIDPTTRSAMLTHTSPGSIASYEHLLPQELVAARHEQDLGLIEYLASADVDTGRQLSE